MKQYDDDSYKAYSVSSNTTHEIETISLCMDNINVLAAWWINAEHWNHTAGHLESAE